MMKPKVLLATPCRDSVTIPYVSGLVGLMSADYGYDLVPSIQRSTYVNVARHDAVAYARELGCDELVFVDADVGWDAKQLLRLLSHDVDVVAGVYAKRVPGEPQWTAHVPLGSKPMENGLQEANDLATGFMRVKMSVFDRIEALNPSRSYQHQGDKTHKYEFFPIGLVGDGTPEARLQAISALLRAYQGDPSGRGLYEDIEAAMGKQTPATCRELLGEDIYFCRLCREAGVKLYADLHLTLRHYGEIGYPANQLPL